MENSNIIKKYFDGDNSEDFDSNVEELLLKTINVQEQLNSYFESKNNSLEKRRAKAFEIFLAEQANSYKPTEEENNEFLYLYENDSEFRKVVADEITKSEDTKVIQLNTTSNNRTRSFMYPLVAVILILITLSVTVLYKSNQLTKKINNSNIALTSENDSLTLLNNRLKQQKIVVAQEMDSLKKKYGILARQYDNKTQENKNTERIIAEVKDNYKNKIAYLQNEIEEKEYELQQKKGAYLLCDNFKNLNSKSETRDSTTQNELIFIKGAKNVIKWNHNLGVEEIFIFKGDNHVFPIHTIKVKNDSLMVLPKLNYGLYILQKNYQNGDPERSLIRIEHPDFMLKNETKNSTLD